MTGSGAAFRYLSPATRIHAGPDALAGLGAEARRSGAQRAFVVCGRSVAYRHALLDQVATALGPCFAGAFTGVEKESPLPAVTAAVAAARGAAADLLVPVGGGSAVVTARATAILLAEEGSAHDLCTKYPPGQPPVSPRLNRPKLPIIAVPTTPTTAVNRAGAAVLDPVAHRRLELFDPKTRPQAVVVDGGALLTAPAPLFAGTALATFVGVVEGFQSRALNPFAAADLAQALALSLENLPRVGGEADGPGVRLSLAVAALLSNRAADALGGGGLGVTAGLAHALQSRYPGVVQGAALAALAVPVMRFNRPVLAAGQARLAAALGLGGAAAADIEAAAAAVTAFLKRLGAATRLRDLQVPAADLPAIAADAMGGFFVRSNPRPVAGSAQLLALLEEAW